MKLSKYTIHFKDIGDITVRAKSLDEATIIATKQAITEQPPKPVESDVEWEISRNLYLMIENQKVNKEA